MTSAILHNHLLWWRVVLPLLWKILRRCQWETIFYCRDATTSRLIANCAYMVVGVLDWLKQN